MEYQEDIRTENVKPDSKGKIDVDNLLEESMKKEETKGKISQEDPDLEERSGGGIQELRAPKLPPPEAQKADRAHMQGMGRQEIQQGAPKEEQGSIGSPAQRAQTGKDLPQPRVGSFIDKCTMCREVGYRGLLGTFQI